MTNAETLMPFVDTGESSRITAIFKGLDGEPIEDPASIATIQLTLEVDGSGTIINARENQDVKSLNGGTLNLDGSFTLDLTASDNAIFEASAGESEVHRAIVSWTWTDSQSGNIEDGTAIWLFTITPLNSAISTVHGTVYLEDDFEVVRGDSYIADDISWADEGLWPDLDGLTVLFTTAGGDLPCDVVGQQVRLELSDTETLAFRDWTDYVVKVTLAGGEEQTLLMGRFNAIQTPGVASSELPAGSPA